MPDATDSLNAKILALEGEIRAKEMLLIGQQQTIENLTGHIKTLREMMKPEVRELIQNKMRRLLDEAAGEIRNRYLDRAWSLIDEAQIYRNAIQKDDQGA